jgi:uncharacterized protein (DUF885 family)
MHMMLAGFGVAAVILSAVVPAQATDKSADARFKALTTREWAWREEQSAGEDDEDGRKPLADHLPKIDAATQQTRLKYWTAVMKELDAIPESKLSAENQINYEVYKPQIQTLINDQHFREYEKPVNSDSSFWSDLSSSHTDPLKNEQDYKNYIAWLGDFPRYFGEQIDNMRAGLKRGFTPPQVTLKGRDLSISKVADAQGDTSPFYAPFKETKPPCAHRP